MLAAASRDKQHSRERAPAAAERLVMEAGQAI
jgi:hypothetical protein